MQQTPEIIDLIVVGTLHSVSELTELYQKIKCCYLTYLAKIIGNSFAEERLNVHVEFDPTTNRNTTHKSVVFNVFARMQIFSGVNARKVTNERHLFAFHKIKKMRQCASQILTVKS